MVDTNVPVTANGKAAHAGPECVLRCVDVLEGIVRRGKVVLDSAGLILEEYRRHLSPSGQPGVGDAFMKWVWNNQANLKRCQRVSITPRGGSAHDFEEFPNEPSLAAFHHDDRKFVAVALASQSIPEVLNATDADWWEYRDALARHGLQIQFLCPELMARGMGR